jgi:DNA-binding transcriptional LysR family regulator
VQIRIGDDSIYRWEFEREGEQLEVNVAGALTIDNGPVALPAIKQGAALMYVAEPMVRQALTEGTLRTVLDEWTSIGPGFHVYYSSRRQLPIGLRLFIDLVRELRPLGL